MKRHQKSSRFQRILQVIILAAVIKSAIFSFFTFVLLLDKNCKKKLCLYGKGEEDIEK